MLSLQFVRLQNDTESDGCFASNFTGLTDLLSCYWTHNKCSDFEQPQTMTRGEKTSYRSNFGLTFLPMRTAVDLS